MVRFGGTPRGEREWSLPTDDTEIFPPVTDDTDDNADGDEQTGEPDEAVETNEPDEQLEGLDETAENVPETQQAARTPAAPDRLAAVGAWLTRFDIPARSKRFAAAVAVRWAQLSAVIVAGLALCFSFPPYDMWYLAFVALGLLAWVLTLEKTTLAGGFGYGFLFGMAFYLPLLPWISGLVGPIPWIGLCVMEALFTALFGLAAVATRRLSGWPFWFAALWATMEWIKSTVPFGGFPWGVVAFSQTDGPLLALAQFGGAPLVSFAVALAGFSLAALTLEVVKWWRGNRVTPPAVVLPGICISAVLLTTALAWPHIRQSGHGAGNDPAITVAAVQGNVPRLGLEFNAQRRAVLDNHVNETQQLANDVAAGRAAQPMVVFWPENSSDIDPLANTDARDQISTAAAAINAPILVGAVVAAPGYSPDNPVTTNSVLVWNPGSGPADRHDKKIIQPFGEYLPWRGFFRHLSSYADRAGYFIPGTGDRVITAAGVPIGVTTCWEVIFDRAAREAVLNGAQLLTVPANNATFTQGMSEQQLAFARLRAVEHDRYVVVAGTVGISAIVAPDGGELARTDFFEPAYLDAQVRLKTQLTPATQWGPQVQGLLVVLGVAAVITAILHNGSFVRRLRRRDNGSRRANDKGDP